jgi:hypothetical protein
MQDRTRAKVWVATAAVLWSAGCGARTELDESRWELDTLEEPGAQDPEVDPSEEPGEEPVVEPRSLPAVAACDLEPIWWQPAPIHRLSPEVFSISPAEHMLMVGGEPFGMGAGVVRLENGDVMTTEYATSPVEGLSTSWERSMTQSWEGDARRVQVIDAERTRVYFEREVTSSQVHAALSADGARLGMAECLYDEGPLGVELTIWDVDDADAPLARTLIEADTCVWYSPDGTHFTIAPDGSSVAYVTNPDRFGEEMEEVQVVTLDARSGAVERAALPMGDEDHEHGGYYGVVASLEYTPAGLLSVVSAHGLRTVFDASLSVVSQEPRGAFVSNPDSYMPPLPMSPVAWTADGEVEASVAEDGAVELRLDDGEVVRRLFAPEASDIAEWTGVTQEVENAPIAVTFSPDDDMVAVAFRKGVGLWGCPGSLPTPRATPREVRLDAPAVATLGDDVPLEMAATGAASGWTVYKLFVDGQMRQTWFDPSEITYRPYQAGQRVLELEVDDGWSPTRSAPVVMEVLER